MKSTPDDGADSRREGLNLKRALRAETQLFVLFSCNREASCQFKKDQRVLGIHDYICFGGFHLVFLHIQLNETC